jgi:hypothetical protein
VSLKRRIKRRYTKDKERWAKYLKRTGPWTIPTRWCKSEELIERYGGVVGEYERDLTERLNNLFGPPDPITKDYLERLEAEAKKQGVTLAAILIREDVDFRPLSTPKSL